MRAPASRFGSDRFSEPHDTYDEKKPPTMFDSPWPRNSRFASMAWPERAATAFAIEIDWPSATIVSATARLTSSGNACRSTTGTSKRGQIAGIDPITAIVPQPAPSPPRFSSAASAVAPTRPISIAGQRGSRRRTASTAAIVKPATASAAGIACPTVCARCATSAAEPCVAGAATPSRSVSACSAISAAAPLVKPCSADGEMKLASAPRRSAPISHCITPTSTVTASASWMYCGEPTAASGASTANSASEFAFVGPETTCQLEPNSAAIAHGTIAV